MCRWNCAIGMHLDFFGGGRLILRLQGVENLCSQTLEGDRRDHNKDLLSRNCMSEMRPCSAMDHQIGSD